MSTDWSGDDYADVSDLQRTMARQSLADLEFDRCERILDIGCGDGFITRSIAEAAAPGFVAGVDPSPLMIATAHRASRADPAGPRYVVGDALRLPFSGPFGAVVSFNALHWVHDQGRALQQIASVLGATGWALIQMVCESDRPSVEDVTQELAVSARWSPHFQGFTPPYFHIDPEDFAELVRASGLELTSCTVAEREWDFGSREAFASWCAVGLGAWTDRLDPRERPDFLDEVVKNYRRLVHRTGLFMFAQLRATMTRH